MSRDRPDITNEDGRVPMELAAIRGHNETRERLAEIRGWEWVAKLDSHCSPYRFAVVAADALKKHRRKDYSSDENPDGEETQWPEADAVQADQSDSDEEQGDSDWEPAWAQDDPRDG